MQTLTEKTPYTDTYIHVHTKKGAWQKPQQRQQPRLVLQASLPVYDAHGTVKLLPFLHPPSSTTRIRKCSSWSSSNRLGSPSISHHRAALSLCGSFSALFRTHMLTYLHAHVVSPVIFLVCAYNCQRAEFVGPVKSQAGWSSPDLSLHVRNKWMYVSAYFEYL